MNSEQSAACQTCGHERLLHHTYGCDGNQAAGQRFWSAFEDLPEYDQTRDEILAKEAQQPPPCGCSAHRFKT